MGNIININNYNNERKSLLNISNSNIEEIEELDPIEHDAQPFKSLEDINRIVIYLREQHRWRDQMLFVLGINFGLRCSDIRMLKFSDIIDTNGNFKQDFCILEKKTSKTRSKKTYRHLSINSAVIEAVNIYLQHTKSRGGKDIQLNDFLFVSESINSSFDKPLQRYSIERIIKGITDELHIEGRYATHSLRKTFGYHIMMQAEKDSDRQILLLMQMFNHSSVQQTLRYIGITTDEIRAGYNKLNLGLIGRSCFDSYFVENVG